MVSKIVKMICTGPQSLPLRFARLGRALVTALCLAAFAATAAPAPAANAKEIEVAASAKKSKSVKKSSSKVKKVTIKKKKKGLRSVRRGRAVSEATYRARFAALVVNADDGQILYEVNAEEIRHPASLTKMMTLYLLFEAMKRGKLDMDSRLSVSSKAAAAPPTNIDLIPGDQITVKTAIESLIVRSANDVAMVVAEGLGGSQAEFADMMNAKARQLGMNDTNFENPSGLPDDQQVSTAYDLARLGIALKRDFPEYYQWFSITEFEFRGRYYEGHNRLLGRYPGTDGIKTGYIGKSGFNLVTSVKRGSWRLVGVIMGGRTAASRDQQMMDMLDNTFDDLVRKHKQVSNDDEKPVKAAAKKG